MADYIETKTSRKYDSSITLIRTKGSMHGVDFISIESSGGNTNISMNLLQALNAFKKDTD